MTQNQIFLTNFIPKRKEQRRSLFRTIVVCVFFTFITTQIISPFPSIARAQTVMDLPVPGTMLNLTAPLTPPILRGLTIHPENPFRFDFIVDKGETGLKGDELKKEYEKLIKYFLATLTIPEDDLWVNLSPYEKDRIIPNEFGLTEMGRDLLGQDYLLKQLMASLTYPESGLGKKFWDEVYKKAYEQYGTTNIPLNTFNKVWIVPDKAVVYENKDKAFIIESHLKVMLEEDYVALQNNLKNEKLGTNRLEENKVQAINSVTSKITKEILIPAIEKEVNEGKNFANLRQIFQSMILAVWYKEALKNKLLNRVYSNRKKIEGVNAADPQAKEKIYQQYIDAFKVGVYNYIKEDYDVQMNKNIPRKYFSGGFTWPESKDGTRTKRVNNENLSAKEKSELEQNPCTQGGCVDLAVLAVDPKVSGSVEEVEGPHFKFIGPLKDKINGGQLIKLEGSTLGEALKYLWKALSEEERKLIFEDGHDPEKEPPPKIKQFIFAALNDEDIRFRNSTDKLPENAQITFIPAIAGGADEFKMETSGADRESVFGRLVMKAVSVKKPLSFIVMIALLSGLGVVSGEYKASAADVLTKNYSSGVSSVIIRTVKGDTFESIIRELALPFKINLEPAEIEDIKKRFISGGQRIEMDGKTLKAGQTFRQKDLVGLIEMVHILKTEEVVARAEIDDNGKKVEVFFLDRIKYLNWDLFSQNPAVTLFNNAILLDLRAFLWNGAINSSPTWDGFVQRLKQTASHERGHTVSMDNVEEGGGPPINIQPASLLKLVRHEISGTIGEMIEGHDPAGTLFSWWEGVSLQYIIGYRMIRSELLKEMGFSDSKLTTWSPESIKDDVWTADDIRRAKEFFKTFKREEIIEAAQRLHERWYGKRIPVTLPPIPAEVEVWWKKNERPPKVNKDDQKKVPLPRNKSRKQKSAQVLPTPGGIDLTRKQLSLQTQGEGVDFNLPFDPNNLENIPLNGLKPQIFWSTPIMDFPLFIGLVEDHSEALSAVR